VSPAISVSFNITNVKSRGPSILAQEGRVRQERWTCFHGGKWKHDVFYVTVNASVIKIHTLVAVVIKNIDANTPFWTFFLPHQDYVVTFFSVLRQELSRTGTNLFSGLIKNATAVA